MRLYNAAPSVHPLPECSVFSFMFPTPDRHHKQSPLFIDAESGYVLKRQEGRDCALALAAGLLRSTRLGQEGQPLSQNDTVLIISPNCLAYVVTFLGLQAAGVRTSLANSLYTPRELAHQLQDSGARVAFVHPALIPVAKEAWELLGVAPAGRIVVLDWDPTRPEATSIDGPWTRLTDLMTAGTMGQEVCFDGSASHSTAFICYSSGTTGMPKGVETTHYNVISTVSNMVELSACSFSSNEVLLSVIPLAHIMGVAALIYTSAYGLPCVLAARFDPDAYCSWIARYKVTTAYAVPPVLAAMLFHPAPTKHDVTSLRNFSSGAAPLRLEIIHAVVKRFESLGCKNFFVNQGYGLTEMSPSVFYMPDRLANSKAGMAGLLVPGLQARLVDENEQDALEGQPGELWVRGPGVMKGYLNNPSATANSITADGFFKTGDIAVRDTDGCYSIVDRKKELIKYKGYQIAPADLEALLCSRPDILDAGVIGVFSPREETEIPRAYVVVHPVAAPRLRTAEDRTKFAAEVGEWVATKVAPYKRLRGGVFLVDAVPRSLAGKILRRVLREEAAKEDAQSVQAKL